MKVAIVHELLTVKGGAENIARQFAAMYPDADVFTLLYDERTLGDWFPRRRVKASRLQRFAEPTRLFNHHLYLPFFRGAVEAWDFSGYDLIVSSSSAFIHGLRVPKGVAHVCYVHTPARYLWDQTLPVQERMSAPARFFASGLFHRLRTWDASAADRPTAIVSASDAVKRRVQLYWGRTSHTVHPFADDAWFAMPPKREPTPHGALLVVANLRAYKRIERAVDACVAAKLPLSVIGDGPARAMLEERAKGGDVRFLGRLEGETLRDAYRGARALLIPGVEDFGINAVESLACGTPVITVRGGGTEEIIDASVGIVCDDTDNAFARAVATPLAIDPTVCRSRAERCSRAVFEQQMYSIVEASLSATANASR
jgi:glycosyltransferase involved in cell wall biosynthesis